FRESYNIIEDDTLMRQGVNLLPKDKAEHFDTLRKKYKIRRELNNFEVSFNSDNEKAKNLLEILRIYHWQH
ncbi:MAG: DUF3410 domain-containing protein, partial [Campylobacterota bacterium]|nr:DUF3410 domain-containing protein [Campylobacterota bacterium]